ncbi:MAG: META domain-containing protein [Xanthomonadales bacterium]|nr:META domain-containing protein [Xanthomonadales bacterium]
MYNLNRATWLALLAASVVACSKEAPPPQAATVVAEPPAKTQVISEAAPVESGDNGLGGTSWRLVQIISMDDSTDVPADPSLYTLDFSADGTVKMQVDCNRGSGSWTSEGDNSLKFGPVATTRAMCPPGSLHDAYLAQFEWVRSYVMRDGHLFLATMADGSIIEFEPTGGD